MKNCWKVIVPTKTLSSPTNPWVTNKATIPRRTLVIHAFGNRYTMSVQIENGAVKSQRKPPGMLLVKSAMLATITAVLYRVTGNEIYLLFLGVLAIPYGMLWIIPPIMLYRRCRINADWSSSLYDPDSPDVPDAVTSTIPDKVARLSVQGFSCVGYFHRQAYSRFPETEGYAALLIHRQSRCAARVGVMYIRNGAAVNIIKVAGCTTEFTDGTRLATTTTDADLPMTGLREGSMAFPEITDPCRLFEIHQAAVNRFCGDAFRRDLWNVDPEQLQRESIERATARLVEIGYYQLDEDRQVYRPTWRGAIALTARMRWPIKPLRSFLARRRAARLLRKLGLNERQTHHS